MGPGLWAEPVNAFTNIGLFLLAHRRTRAGAGLEYRNDHRNDSGDRYWKFPVSYHANRCYALVIYLAMRALLVNLSTGSDGWHNR
jgi:hypothetical protein